MDNAASLVAMLLWMSRTGRGSQLDSFILSCQGYMAATGRDNLFVMVEVKKAIKTIKAINPGVPQPVTSGTRKLARASLDLIPTIASSPRIALAVRSGDHFLSILATPKVLVQCVINRNLVCGRHPHKQTRRTSNAPTRDDTN